jgi:hypothetical protein
MTRLATYCRVGWSAYGGSPELALLPCCSGHPEMRELQCNRLVTTTTGLSRPIFRTIWA